MRRFGMARPGETVTVALSGGADSVCLFLLLRELRGTLGISLSAVHVNHMLRGEAADADEAFVRALCEECEVPLEVYRRDVAAAARSGGKDAQGRTGRETVPAAGGPADTAAGTEEQPAACSGLEEAGRRVRREIYGRYGKVALAHHMGDQAETFLFRAVRGASLAGLSAMRPVELLNRPEAEGDLSGAPSGAAESAPEPGTVLIRPLLEVSRQEIGAYLTARGQCWREDATNRDPAYARNAIRGRIIPELERLVNSGAVRHLAEAAETAAAADAFLREEALRRGGEFLPEDGRVTDGILGLPDVLQGYLLREALRRAGGLRDIGQEHFARLKELFKTRTGKRLTLPNGLTAVRGYGEVKLAVQPEKRVDAPPEGAAGDIREVNGEVFLAGPGRYRLGAWTFVCTLTEVPPVIEEKTYTKWFDYDKINSALALRTRRAGDFITVDAGGGRKKLKDYLIDEKIPQDGRADIPLFASGSEVHWVVGHRIGETCKITAETRRALRVEARKEGMDPGRG